MIAGVFWSVTRKSGRVAVAPHDLGVVVASRRGHIIAAARTEHAPSLADGDHRIVYVVGAPELRNLREHTIAECVDIIFDADVGRTRIYDNLVVGERHSRTRKNPENLCATTTDNDWGLTSR
jgi:hypothetical protein